MSRSTRESSGLRPQAGVDSFDTPWLGGAEGPFTDWDCGTAVMDAPAEATSPRGHDLEQSVCRELRRQSKLRFKSLVVRRTQDGILLEGVMEQDAGAPNIADIVRAIGVARVDNRLVVANKG
ncbi:MAG: hypothetical protein IT428_16705 [Planctomycetaceae bacterium]|nr:hypothetical protein [Planctomycetaceae bacterium]